MAPIQAQHIILALALLLVACLMAYKFKRMKKMGDTIELKPRNLILIIVILIINTALFIHQHQPQGKDLLLFWLAPFIPAVIIAMLYTRNDPLSLNKDTGKIRIPAKRIKLLLLLISTYVLIYFCILFINIHLMNNPDVLAGYIAAKGLVAGLTIGMNIMYFYQYLQLNKSK